jgi:DNA-binding NtrC family response regulator
MDKQEKKSTAGGSAKSPKLIYVVDDEPMLLDLASIILSSSGFQVRTFRDPQEALASYAAANPRPELVVTDYAMGSMTGLGLMHACRKLDPKQKFMMVSGTADEDFFDNAGVDLDAFLPKPYQAAQLTAMVKKLISERKNGG